MNSNNRLLNWKLWLPLAFQSAIIVAIPAQSFYTLMTGKTVVLQTAPVDPYDFLRGYSQTLSYDISNTTNLEKLPGWKTSQRDNRANRNIYVVVQAPNSNKQPPQPWRAVKVSEVLPSLSANQVAVKGRVNYGRIEYGLERYYMPESLKDRINREISQASWGKSQQPIVVEAKVGNSGQAVIRSFWIGDRNYRF